MKKAFVIVGSVNMDVSLSVERLPGPGETLLASDLRVSGGGKGGNQAVAAARLGGACRLVARLGRDAYGEQLLAAFDEAGVDTRGVRFDDQAPTGQAYINVAANGENNIVVVPGANGRLDPAQIQESADLLEDAAFCCAQMEIPLESVRAAARLAFERGVPFVLNPSPAVPLDDDFLSKIDILVPNEHELAILAGCDGPLEAQLQSLLDCGVKTIVLTLGGEGVCCATKEGRTRYPATPRRVVDTTAAGDTFLGGLLTGLAEGRSLAEAIGFAQEAAGITVARPGAQDAIPSRAEVDRALAAGSAS